jgi:hypothetical protein
MAYIISMHNQEEIDQQQALLTIHRRTLSHYLSQQAAVGAAFVPPAVAQGIHEARENIRRIKDTLRRWGLTVANHPDDEGPVHAVPHEEPSTSIPLPRRPTVSELASFSAGPPIAHPRSFFGRDRALKRLFNLWQRPPLQNAAIVGPRRAGKTSLLLHLARITCMPSEELRPGQRADWLPDPERYRWIYVDFQDPRLGRREGLLRYLLTCLEMPLPNPCNLDRFLEVASNDLHTPTIILLDEIDVALQRYQELDTTFWEGIRALASSQVNGNLGFVLTTHTPLDQVAYHAGHSSPFFNIFGYTATLGPLTATEAHDLIRSSPIPFLHSDIEWILAQSGCWPILLNILCRERLATLEDGEDGEEWRAEGLRQLAPFRHLLG